MNVSTANDAQEYRASMQRAALTFLQRHQGEHLTDDGLCSNAPSATWSTRWTCRPSWRIGWYTWP